MVAVEVPPGSTAGVCSPFGMVMVKSCAWQKSEAANKIATKEMRIAWRAFTMNGDKLTTFDSSKGANAA